ncbi:MAG: polysaccharide deacetylase family protein [Gaiellaceae bacterium]
MALSTGLMRIHRRARLGWARRRCQADDWSGVRILGYHRVSDSPHDLSVSPAAFRRQMEHVRASSAAPIGLEQAFDLLGSEVPGRYVCVTLDDGYRDNLENAVPVLRELEIPATIFVPTAVIDGEATYDWFEDPPPALTWEEIDGIVSEGLVDVQAHSRTHRRLPALADDQARLEIVGAKLDLERHVPYPVTSFCFPAGLYGAREVALVQEAGYRAGLTTDPGVNRGGAPLETLKRTLIYWDDEPEGFDAKYAGLLDKPPLLRALLYRGLRKR